MRGWLVVAWLAGCHLTPQQEAEDVCTAYCKCAAPNFPGEQRTCIEQQCLPQLPPVKPECLDCVFSHDQTCTDLATQCDSLCLR